MKSYKKILQKTPLNAENKQTFGLTGKIEISEKSRQNAENKQTFSLTGKNCSLRPQKNESLKEHFQTFFVVFRRPVVKARLVRSPDKDGHGGDVKVFSLFPPLFGLCMDDTLDSFCLLLLATFGS